MFHLRSFVYAAYLLVLLGAGVRESAVLKNNFTMKLSSYGVKPVQYLPYLLLILKVTNCAKNDSPPKESFESAQYGVRYADSCEACKITAAELQAKLTETGKNREMLQTSYHIDTKDVKKQEYKKSEVRLIESMETACESIMKYNIHKERKDSTRFAKGQSQTFQTLHGLVAKGVKVDIGMPYEMWDKPATEITDLKAKCENLIEKYESEIEEWYNAGENTPLVDYLCRNIVLKGKEDKCLEEKEIDLDQGKEEKLRGEL